MAQISTGHVFMSYSRRDTDVMQRIVKYLRGQGFTVWVDNEELVPGTPIWEKEIEKAIRATKAVVVILSPDSKESVWVLNELTLADEYKKRIFPVLVRGEFRDSIPFRLVTRQFVDLRINELAGFISLSKAIHNYLDEIKRADDEEVMREREQPTEEPEKTEQKNGKEINQNIKQKAEHVALRASINQNNISKAKTTDNSSTHSIKPTLLDFKFSQHSKSFGSIIQSFIGDGKENSITKGIWIVIFGILSLTIFLPWLLSFFGLQIQNVVMVFWGFVIAFGFVGLRRSWAKDALVLSSVVFGLTLVHILYKYIPLLRSLPYESTYIFWFRTTIIVTLACFGYRVGSKIQINSSSRVRNRFQNNRFGIISSAINGYLIIGTILFFNHVANYDPLWWVIPRPTNPLLIEAASILMLYMPPQLLGDPGIYFIMFMAFILVFIILV